MPMAASHPRAVSIGSPAVSYHMPLNLGEQAGSHCRVQSKDSLQVTLQSIWVFKLSIQAQTTTCIRSLAFRNRTTARAFRNVTDVYDRCLLDQGNLLILSSLRMQIMNRQKPSSPAKVLTIGAGRGSALYAWPRIQSLPIPHTSTVSLCKGRGPLPIDESC